MVKKNIYLALSAGDDSRLVLCMLKRLKFQNVTCFSYGLHNNWESALAKKIAERLGYKFIFIPISSDVIKNYFKSEKFNKYFNKLDFFDSTPLLHEVYVINSLKKKINKDSIILNGQPEDAINGSYMYSDFIYYNKNKNKAINAILNKHYSLWTNLKNKKNQYLVNKFVFEDINDYFKQKKKIFTNICYLQVIKIDFVNIY